MFNVFWLEHQRDPLVTWDVEFFQYNKKTQNSLSCCPINQPFGGSKQETWRMIWFGYSHFNLSVISLILFCLETFTRKDFPQGKGHFTLMRKLWLSFTREYEKMGRSWDLEVAAMTWGVPWGIHLKGGYETVLGPKIECSGIQSGRDVWVPGQHNFALI